MILYADIKCPNCGFDQTFKFEEVGRHNRPEVVLCDIEGGGCDQYFAVEIELQPRIRVYEMDLVVWRNENDE